MAARVKPIREDLKDFFDLKVKKIQSFMTDLLDNFKQDQTILNSINKSVDTGKLVQWIFENPTCTPHLKRWLSANGGQNIIQKLGKETLACRSKGNNAKAKDCKFFQAWGGNAVDEASLAAFVKMIDQKMYLQEQKMKKMKSHGQILETKIKKLTQKVSELEKELETEREKRAQTENDLKAVKQKYVTVQDDLVKAKAVIAKLREELGKQKYQSDNVIQKLQKENLRKSEEIKDIERLNAMYRDEIKELKVKLSKSDETIYTLEQERDKMEAEMIETMKSEPDEDDNVSLAADSIFLPIP